MEQNQNPQPPVFNPGQPVQQPNPQYQPMVKPRPLLGFVEAVKICFSKFFDFKGRARRSEYWWFFLFCMLVSWVFNLLGSIWPALSIICLLVSIVLLIPSCSVQTRRLHDTGRSGWWVVVQILLMLTAYGSLCAMLIPHADKVMVLTDNMEMMNLMMDAFEQSPTAVAVMGISLVLLTIVTIILIVFSVKDSHWNENKYGPSPKYQ
ncbi:MAG: DUF805 domain-containing protein [Muribaculaceae bacterium]|nr:DUF805 domain-containing protein [Muribaculaceae bacterium]